MSIGPTKDLGSKLAFDTRGMGELRQSAKAGSPDALKGAATQFEAMFLNMMMKTMREATPTDEGGISDSQSSKMFTSMLDQQMSQNMAKRGVGLADMLIRQMVSQQAGTQALAIGGAQASAAAQLPSALPGTLPAPFSDQLAGYVPGNMGGQGQGYLPGQLPALAPGMPQVASKSVKAALAGALAGLQPAAGAAAPRVTHAASGRVQAPHVRQFQEKLMSHAKEAEQATGIPAKFMLGQAALETGWGRREIRNPDGSNSNNLFGIKAGPGWKGKVAIATTTEYVNGVPQTRVEKFRAYATPADSFKDYAKLITHNPRYEKVLANAKDASGFAHGLQKAGYATDPLYAAKLTRIIHNNLA